MMSRLLTAFIAAAVLAAMPGTAASASVEVTPPSAAAAATVDVTFTVANQRPTGNLTRVEVSLPERSGVTQADVAPIAGWSSTQNRDDSDQLASITWSKGEIAPGASEAFVVTLTLPSDRDALEFAVTEAYSDGTVLRSPAVSGGDGPTLAIAGGATTTTTAGTTTTAVADPAATTKKSKSHVGNYLIGFGVVVILFLYMRTKASLKGPRRR